MWSLKPDSLVNFAHLSKFMFGGPWSGRPAAGDDPKHGVGRRSPRLTGYSPWRAHQNITWRTVNAAFVLAERRHRL